MSRAITDLAYRNSVDPKVIRSFVSGRGAGKAAAGKAGTDTAAAEAAPVAVVKEKESFDLKLKVVDAKAKIKIIKEVRVITGLGLKEVMMLLSLCVKFSYHIV